MNTKLSKLYLLVALVNTISIACNNQKTQKESKAKIHVKTDNKPITTQKTNFELLQGKWVHENDNTNFLIFEKNVRKEIAEGMKNWDEEEFVLSNSCSNESNLSETSTKEKDCYISCKNSDFCWYIMSISEDRLTLQYLNRGNLLIYNRVKK
jgi:hypothetical protein